MKATSPSPCSGKAPFTWTNSEAGVYWSPSEEKSHSQFQASPSATQNRGFLWPWTGSSWFKSWSFVTHLSPSLLKASFIRGNLSPNYFLFYGSGASDPFGYRHSNQAHLSQHHPLQASRPDIAPLSPKQAPASPAQSTASLHTSAYPPLHSLGNGILHSHGSYGSPTQESPYYTTHPSIYTTATAPAQYSSSGPSDLMATTAQMQRPPYPPMYHTPQSNSPSSVASQPHDQHGRNIYAQSPQMPPQMYGYPPYSVQPPYAPHQSPQSHTITSQSMMMPPQTSTAQMSPHQPSHTPSTALSSSPVMKMDSTAQPSSTQRSMLNPALPAAVSTSIPAVTQQTSPLGTSSSAAPGPIPATTPLVVRQDNNGVQWIAFEYSRDRVKMEYTIRCDVESVNVDSLSQDFKTENCVYPRACCNKDQYRGNRLVYETECNAVGWALAELNPALRGKRGLIQRAVDSWRNSNQDPRLRSRRVRRQHKMNRRQSVQPATPHMTPVGPVGHGMSGGSGQRGSIGPLMGMTHHHAQPDGSPKMEEVSGITPSLHAVPRRLISPLVRFPHSIGTTDYINPQRSIDTSRLPAPLGATDIRPAQTFHDAHTIPSATSTSPSMAPLLRDSGLGSLGRHPTIATSSHMASVVDLDEQSPTNDDLFGQLPDGKRRTFILVEDPQRGSRVRVKVGLDKVKMDEIPDSYRKINAVYPRTYFPTQMKDAQVLVDPSKRFFAEDVEHIGDPEDSTVGRTTVPAPSLDGERDIDVPKLSRRRHRKEVMLNDLAYRLSWSQSRVFAGRMLFLQRSLDAYRNKMRTSMLAAGQEASEIPKHFDTRRGKRRFLERARHLESDAPSAAQRSAEEVEG
ncbi:hypothetical protein N7454_002111 [Penicillium verhagenii]|nr:hypothetical protein N7454_002111 [Penicillium verhagenii]